MLYLSDMKIYGFLCIDRVCLKKVRIKEDNICWLCLRVQLLFCVKQHTVYESYKVQVQQFAVSGMYGFALPWFENLKEMSVGVSVVDVFFSELQ